MTTRPQSGQPRPNALPTLPTDAAQAAFRKSEQHDLAPDDSCGCGLPDDAKGPASSTEESIRLFTEGDMLYAAMLASIRGARETIRMESYIFASDEVGWQFAEALAERAAAGVDVRRPLDAVGGWRCSATCATVACACDADWGLLELEADHHPWLRQPHACHAAIGDLVTQLQRPTIPLPTAGLASGPGR